MVARALDPDNSSIMVCGGAGVAMHATRTLKDMGAWVWMLQRTENNRPEIEKMMAFLVKGDALETATIKKAMDGARHKPPIVHTSTDTSAYSRANPDVASPRNCAMC